MMLVVEMQAEKIYKNVTFSEVYILLQPGSVIVLLLYVVRS